MASIAVQAGVLLVMAVLLHSSRPAHAEVVESHHIDVILPNQRPCPKFCPEIYQPVSRGKSDPRAGSAPFRNKAECAPKGKPRWFKRRHLSPTPDGARRAADELRSCDASRTAPASRHRQD
ncbi:Protein of unknown function [Gryllus bimaculatus]|nr:Protein of unknown function [Gryllus bimaculatus]